MKNRAIVEYNGLDRLQMQPWKPKERSFDQPVPRRVDPIRDMNGTSLGVLSPWRMVDRNTVPTGNAVDVANDLKLTPNVAVVAIFAFGTVGVRVDGCGVIDAVVSATFAALVKVGPVLSRGRRWGIGRRRSGIGGRFYMRGFNLSILGGVRIWTMPRKGSSSLRRCRRATGSKAGQNCDKRSAWESRRDGGSEHGIRQSRKRINRLTPGRRRQGGRMRDRSSDATLAASNHEYTTSRRRFCVNLHVPRSATGTSPDRVCYLGMLCDTSGM